MQVKRALLYSVMGAKADIKALALLMLLKERLGITSSLKKASINKIAAKAGVSPSTIKRYMAIWEHWGIVEWRGSRHDVFVVKKMSSSAKHRNLELNKLNFKNFKILYDHLRSFLFVMANARKEFVKRMIRIVTNPRRGEDWKKAKKSCNHLVVTKDNEKGFVYKEYGFSYKGIGNALGFCARTAEKIVDFAIGKHWCKKERHYDWSFLPNVCGMYVEGYTFTTRNYGYIIKANTYEAAPFLRMALIGGKK